MNPFQQRYQAYSDAALLDILDHSADYLPEALAAAQAELNGRKLSEQAVEDARRAYRAAKEARQDRLQLPAPLVEAGKKAKSSLAVLFDTLNPIQNAVPTAEKWISWITIVMGLLALTSWASQFQLVVFMLMEFLREWDFSIVEFFLPLLVLPMATLLFAWRKKAGWHLLAAYLTYSAIQSLGLIVLSLGWESSGTPGLDLLLPQPSIVQHVLATSFFGGVLVVMAKRMIRERFQVKESAAILTIVAVGALTSLLILPYLFD